MKSADDDFMPKKKVQNKSKTCASTKSGRSNKSVASSKGAMLIMISPMSLCEGN